MKNITKAILFFCAFTMFQHPAFSQQITGISPNQIIGGKAEILTISGTGFGAEKGNSYVSFFREDNSYTNAEQSNKFRYISWSNNEIKLEMPVAFSNKIKMNVNGKEIFSSDTLRVMANLGYRQENPLVYDLLTRQNSRGGITWFVHPLYWNNLEIREAIASVIREFRCKTGVNFIMEAYPEWIPLSLNQGKYLIAPDSGLGVVGFNDRMWSSCILGAETFYHTSAQIIRLNTQQNWYYGTGQPPAGFAKFRYVLFHEMGHSLGLGHVNELGESMFPSVTNLPSDNWCARDSITSAERNAISYFISLSQNFSFRACGLSPMEQNMDCNDVYGSGLTSVETNNTSLSVEIFPNPVKDVLYFRHALSGPVEVFLYDQTGRLCDQEHLKNGAALHLDKSLNNGLYLLRIHGSGQSFSKRIWVQR